MIFPCGVFAEPQEVAVIIGHLMRDADLVAVEVVGLLAAFAFFVGPVVDLCQGFVRTAHTLRQGWRFRTGYGIANFGSIPDILLYQK